MTPTTFSVSFDSLAAHCLEEIAAGDYRTVEHLIQILVYQGMQSYQFDRELVVPKRPEDHDPSLNSKFQYYTNEEIVESFKPKVK